MSDTSLKILHIMAGKGLGGAETYSADVMLSLHRAGIDQCVVISRHAPRFAELEAAGIRLAPWVMDVPTTFLRRVMLSILVQREQPTIIHCWMRRAASFLSSSYAKTMPVIGWFGGYYDPKHFRKCSHFVGVTKDIIAHMVRNHVRTDRAKFIPTFPDIVTMSPVDRALLTTPKTAKVVLALSRLHPKKGIDTLLQAATQLQDCYIWLAGEGPLRKQLEALAKELNVIDRVRFLGWRTDRAALLRAADVCVLPSRYEPFGTVILEAWAAGTVFVACRSAGPVAHVEDGVNGLLAPIDDAHALAVAIRRTLDDEPLRRSLISKGYSTYVENYTREAVTQQWIAYYNALLAERA